MLCFLSRSSVKCAYLELLGLVRIFTSQLADLPYLEVSPTCSFPIAFCLVPVLQEPKGGDTPLRLNDWTSFFSSRIFDEINIEGTSGSQFTSPTPSVHHHIFVDGPACWIFSRGPIKTHSSNLAPNRIPTLIVAPDGSHSYVYSSWAIWWIHAFASLVTKMAHFVGYRISSLVLLFCCLLCFCTTLETEYISFPLITENV